MINNNRIESLDWLRGLMALSIMIYHLSYWIFQPCDASSFLGRMGIYGVSIFFVLSGLSMSIVYNSSIDSVKKLFSFILKRFIRIIPLLFIATTFTLIYNIVFKNFEFNLKQYFLNVTSLFGFFDHDIYIATGAWSIGNEMVYYSLTPLIFLVYNKSKIFGNILFFGTILIGCYFSFLLLNPADTIQNQWGIYINPFNNLFLYVAGIAIYYNLKNVKIRANYLLLSFCVLGFIFYPVHGNSIMITTGFTRIFFCVLSVLIVVCFYKMEINLPKMLSYTLETFGLATYGIYMFHPIIYKFFKLSNEITNNPYLFFTFIVFSTIVISILSYNQFEMRLSKLGKQFITKHLKC